MDQNPGSETLRNSVNESVLLCMDRVLGRHLASQASPGVGLEPEPLVDIRQEQHTSFSQQCTELFIAHSISKCVHTVFTCKSFNLHPYLDMKVSSE